MGQHIAAVIEPRSLMREALVSLMESNSYDVVCSVNSVADIENGAFQDVQPKLVILGALPAERTAEATSRGSSERIPADSQTCTTSFRPRSITTAEAMRSRS